MTFLRSVRLKRVLLSLWTAFCSEEWGYNCNIGRTNWTCSGLSCLIFPVSFLFFFSLAASTHDWDFPTDKVLASLGANMLIAKRALWTAACAVSFDASQDQGWPLYLCLPPEHQSLTVLVCRMSAERVLGRWLSYFLWDNFFPRLVIFRYFLFQSCLDFMRNRSVEEIKGKY